MPEEKLGQLSLGSLLLSPTKMPTSEISLAVFGNSVEHYVPRHIILDIAIVDDHEKRPLFNGVSESRCLMLLHEIVKNIAHALAMLRFDLVNIKVRDHRLHLEFASLLEGREFLGGYVAFLTYVDSLLFERGLKMSSSTIKIVPSDDDRKTLALLEKILASFS